jgi:hypothetical protein
LTNWEAALSDLAPNTPEIGKPKRPKRAFRTERPERLTIGGEEMVRNDVVAREVGSCERTLNRGDWLGAPFIMLGGVKYRPIARYHAFLLERIQVRNQPPKKRRGRR